jgi:glycosyltransferase involved in cell wall biosynthesis
MASHCDDRTNERGASRASVASVSDAAIPLGLVVGDWLPYSETFIYQQIRQQRAFVAHVLARSRRREGSRFPYARLTSLGPVERITYLTSGRCPSFAHVIRRHGVRLIHAHFGLNGVLALPLARTLGVPLVVMFHGHDVGGLFPHNRFRPRYFRYQRQAQTMFEYASLLLCASEELAALLARFGAPERKIRVQRLGIELERFGFVSERSGEPRVLAVGRLVEKKGFEFAIRAFAEVRRAQPEARLCIVGDGPLRHQLMGLADELGQKASVTFCGPLSSEAVHAEMRAAHVLVAPSVVAKDGDRESGVMVLKEAAATGLPTIGTRHGGIPEIIEHGETGFLVAERSVAELADRMRTVLGDARLARHMGRRARAKMERQYDAILQNRELEAQLLSALA